MTDQPAPLAQTNLPVQRRWLLWSIGALALLLVVLLIRALTAHNPTTPALVSNAEALMTQSEKAIVDSIETERRNLALVQLNSVRHQADRVIQTLEALDAETTAWGQQVVTLLSSPEGNVVAADAGSVIAFDAVYSAEHPIWGDNAERRKNLATLIAPVDAAIREKSTAYTPSDALNKQLELLDRQARTELSERRQARETILAICATARAAGKTGTITLADALARLKQTRAAETAAKLAEARQRVEKQRNEELAALEERMAREIADAELKRREAELQAKKLAIQSEAKQNEEKDRLARLRKLAEDPAIQAKYQPFLAKGVYKLGEVPGTGYEVYNPPKPVSYNDLVKFGILRDVRMLVNAATGEGEYRKQDRPRWPMPRTEAEWEEVRQRLEELRELAPIWRDMGLLQP